MNAKLEKMDSGVVKTFLQSLVQKLPNIPVPEDLLRVPDDIKDAVNILNGFLLALFVFFVLGAGLAGLSVIFCLVAFISTSRLWIWVNVATAALAALALAVGSIITTVMAKRAESINEKGQEVGITASAGTKFMAITWASFALMIIALFFWLIPQCHGRRSKSRNHRVADREKAAAAKQSMDSHRSQNRFFRRHR